MRYFLAKTDPETYSIADLERDGATVWDGVKNPQALRAVNQMRPGDKVFVYHSGGESAIVGLAEVVSQPRPDAKNARLTVIDLRFLSLLGPPTTLKEIKQSGRFSEWALVRQGRLSTMDAPAAFVDWMRQRHPKAGI